jgi:hypothetical protein
VTRRKTGQVLAALIALASFICAAREAHNSSIPQIGVFDGFWMMLGATVAMLVVGPLVWRWPRERSLVAVALASVLGSVVPLAISAARHHMPLTARLRGSWVIGGADVVGPALVIGFVCLWFALREHGTRSSRVKSESRAR